MRVSKGAGRGLAIFLALTMVLSVFVGGAMASSPTSKVKMDGDTSAPNPQFTVDSLTVASHPVANGLSDNAMAGVYDDNGEWDSDPGFYVNTTSPEAGVNENPYTFKPGHIDDPDFGIFPRTGTNDDGEQLASVLDSSEWSTDASGTAGSIAVSDTEVAEGVEAVNVDVSGTSGDVAVASYDNWTSELDSDEEKRTLQIAGDINELGADTNVDIALIDEDGDEKVVTINASDDAANEEVLADATGDSYVTQVKLSDLSTVSNGDGDYNNIETLEISVEDGNFEGSFSWIDAESKSKDVLGVETVDSDDDGEYDETSEIYQAQGAISVNSMETLGGEFDNAVLNDVSFPAIFEAAEIEGEEGDEGVYQIQWDGADSYPAYDAVYNASYRMELPGYIDLSYSGVTLEMEQGWNTERYTKLAYAEGVSEDTAFSDVTTTDVSGNLGDVGDMATIDDTVQIGTGYTIHTMVKMTDDEKNIVQDEGGSAPPPEDSSGGFVNFITTVPGMLLSAAVGILGWSRTKLWPFGG